MPQTSTIPTSPYKDQKPGTSGLRKKTSVFLQQNYLQNFVQSIFDTVGPSVQANSLVVGGDGRFFGKEATEIIIRMAAGNKVKKVLVAKEGIMSTPAISCVIRKCNAIGGIVLTASHNPGGPDNDFGIKYNSDNGGPASAAITDAIYEKSLTISQYYICNDINIDISQTGVHSFDVDGKDFSVEVIDGVSDYADYMQEIFDFDTIKSYIMESQLKITLNALNGVMGPYVKEVMCRRLEIPDEYAENCTPLPDFGGLHPDPNLTYASSLVDTMKNGFFDIGAAFDGDGDRNMILGKNAVFVSPSDSLAVLADHLTCIPYFKRFGVKGYARSMPTSAAVDRVAAAKGLPVYEVPTGWKFFGNLMDDGRLSLCGEESFGTGSDHIREKDGMWAVLAWLSVMADTRMSVEQLLTNHWLKYGRNFFTRYDYEDCAAADANLMMAHIQSLLETGALVGSESADGYKVVHMDDFAYTDPVDHAVTKGQGIRVLFADGSRVIFRLSGTGSSGATIRLYIESYQKDAEKINLDPQVVLMPLVRFALETSKLHEFTGRLEPTVIT